MTSYAEQPEPDRPDDWPMRQRPRLAFEPDAGDIPHPPWRQAGEPPPGGLVWDDADPDIASAWRDGSSGSPGSGPGPANLGPGANLFPSRADDEAWAILSYLSAVLLGFAAPLAIYLIDARLRNSPFVRAHAAQAVNFAVTMALYTISALIVGGMLALDSVAAGLVIGGGIAIVLWLVALLTLSRAVLAARDGGFYRLPGWLCATVLRT